MDEREQPKLCLVTGAGGFCGSYMVELLLERGYRVRATDLEATERGIYKDVLQREGVEFIPSDLTKKETLKPVVKDVQIVFHPAALFSYSARWEQLYKVNVEGTRNLCEALIEEGKVEKFILWSTAGVYGLPKPEYLPIREGYTPNPSNLYEKSKYLQEQVCMEFYQERNFPLIIIRPVPIYGPRNIYGAAQLLLGLAKFPIFIIPKNYHFGLPSVHVKDVCNAALYLAEKERRSGQIYNVVDDGNFTIYDFFKLLSEILGKKFITVPKVPLSVVTIIGKIVHFILKIITIILPLGILIYFRETTLYSTGDYKFSNQKLKSFGYKFLYPSLADGIRETIEWYKQQKMLK